MSRASHAPAIAECLSAMDRIRAPAESDERRICPGHDSEVWQKFPEVKPGIHRLA